MSDSVTLRPAAPQDAEFLFAVYAASRQQELAQVPWDDAFRDAFLRQQFQAQHLYYQKLFATADFLVIEKSGVPIGRLYVARRDDEIHIIDIALLTQHRNGGIGSDLIKNILAEADDTSRPVRLHVEKFNPALALYQRLGFRIREDRDVYLLLEWTATPPESPR